MGKLKSKFIEEKVFVGLMWIAVAVVLLVTKKKMSATK